MIAKKPISDGLRREIEVRAYLIWEGEGRPHGCEREHWTRAEAEVLGVATLTAPAKKAAPAKATSTVAAKPAAKAVAAKATVVPTKTKKKTKPKSS